MTPYRTTKFQFHGSAAIPPFWFVQADEAQRESTQSSLDEVVDRLIQTSPELRKKNIVGISWLQNYAASAADVFATAHGFDTGEGHALGIDTQTLVDETLLALLRVNENSKIGRVAREEAVSVLLTDHPYKYTLAEAFNGRPGTHVPVPVRISEPIIEGRQIECILPPHIPRGTKLDEDRIGLFSLIKLMVEEVCVLKQSMEDTTDEMRPTSTIGRTGFLRYKPRYTINTIV